MSTPYLAEIRVTSFNFAPKGWALCNGQLLPINQNQALFSLLGTTYGGNGQTNFALPDLRGRVPMHWGNAFTLGQRAGEEAHTLTLGELPAHTHTIKASSIDGNVTAPGSGTVFSASSSRDKQFTNDTPNVGMAASAISSFGGNQPHENRAPFLTLNFIIALQGIFPSQS